MTKLFGKKWCLLILVSVAVSLLLELVQINTRPEIFTPAATAEMQQNETRVYPDSDYFIGMSGYEATESGLNITEPDPQMYFITDSISPFSNVSFYFSSPTSVSYRIQVFYPNEEGYYSEQASVVSNSPADITYWSIEIPEGFYDQLRIDIDGSPIPLSSIAIGNIPAEHVPIREPFHFLRIIIVAILLCAVLFWIAWTDGWKRFSSTVRAGMKEIKSNGKKSIIYAMIFPVAVGVSIGLFWLFCSVFSSKPMTVPRIVFAAFAGFFAASLFVFRKALKTQPEYLFLILVLCVGSLYCYYVPHTGLNGWDEDVHFTAALTTSYVDSIVLTPQDNVTIARSVAPSFDLNNGVQSIHDKQDLLYHSGATEMKAYIHPNMLPELFNGIGLFLGRALGMRYYMIHFMGRFTCLLTFALTGFFAIRKLKSGKMIAMISLLVPTSLYLASSYNYDSYLTSFTVLGLSYYLAQWQDPEAKLTLRDALIMLGALAFGCLPKPVYLPLLWIPILLPKQKFISRKYHTLFILGMLAASFAVVFAYILPTLKPGATNSLASFVEDTRAGSAISVPLQIQYILSHPIEYIGVIWRYLTGEYLNLNRLAEFMTNFAYHGTMPNQYIYLVLMFVVAFTDKNDYDHSLIHRPWAHAWPLLVSLGTTVLVMTSMYLAFTPVGQSRVDGAQFRYLIPMVFPVLMHIGSGKMDNKMDRGWYNALVFIVVAFVEFSCVYNAFINQYI